MLSNYLPYSTQSIDQEDIDAVIRVLQSGWLTTGPTVNHFEEAVAAFCETRYGIAVANGTAALHAAVHAAGIGHGDEVIVPTLSFVATANAVVYAGATPIFADVLPHTLLLDPVQVENKISSKTKAIIAMDYAGQPCNYNQLLDLCRKYRLLLIADACHSLGADYNRRKSGGLAHLTAFSFHPAKPITSGEGGMVLTDNEQYAVKIRTFRNHGITSDFRTRQFQKDWHYEMVELGYNLRLSDIHAALGLSQLSKIDRWTAERNNIAGLYTKAFAGDGAIQPLTCRPDVTHSYHLYVVRVPNRSKIFAAMRQENIGVNVHYLPIHLHPYYRERFGCKPGDCPVAEKAYENILSLPLFPGMRAEDINRVIDCLHEAIREHGNEESP